MTNDKMCPPLFSGKVIICPKGQCHLWDDDRNQCLAKLFLAGYMKQQLVAQKMMGLYDTLQTKLDKEEF